MKGKLMKVLSLAMALTLVASLAACGGNSEEETTTSAENTTIEEVVPGDDVSVDGETPADESTEAGTAANGETAAPQPNTPNQPATKPNGGNNGGNAGGNTEDQKLPTDKASLMNMFNQAGFKTAKLTRKLTSGKIKALKVVEIDLSGEEAVKKAFADTSKTKVNAGQKLTTCASATATGTMKNGTITFNLANVGSTKAPQLKHGANGYLYFIDISEAQVVANNILGQLNLGTCTVKPDKSTISLSNGKIVATVQNGKVVKATYTFSETAVASASYKGLPADATIAGTGTVVFS